MIRAYPLSWPDGWKRSKPGGIKNGRFTRNTQWITVAEGAGRIMESLGKMGIHRDNIVISTNVEPRLDGLPRSGQPEPQDRGAAVYWRKTQNAPRKCMAIDLYTTVADNLGAIAATLEAMRAIERHGGAEILDRAFTGFAALPSSTSRPWREVFGIPDAPPIREGIELRYKELARKFHPDTGGSHEAMAELNVARDEALREASQ